MGKVAGQQPAEGFRVLADTAAASVVGEEFYSINVGEQAVALNFGSGADNV